MFLLKKEELKEAWSVVRIVLALILGCWLIVSCVAGAVSGAAGACEYNSVASRMNFGYVLTCELWKPRWKISKEENCRQKTIVSAKLINYMENISLVVFDDGTSKNVSIPDDMIGKKIQVCN
jgi:hypothetical protein